MVLQNHSVLHVRALIPAATVLLGLFTVKSAVADDKYCLDYFTVGDSKCQPTESTPIARSTQVPNQTPQLVPPPSDVDKFLTNYGKPPREFVEFYLNPTAENATKWAAAYQQIVQKGKDISKAWNQADQLYQSNGTSQQPVPTLQAGLTTPPAPTAVPPSPAQPIASSSFGGLADRNFAASVASGGVRMTPIKLTYYFSQICPYCARMTPDLAVLSKDKKSTLVFTCVDVTPVGSQSKPNEAFITSKLPCKWRLPEDGEVEREDVKLTPTMVIEKQGSAPVRLSGYVPLTQLRQYF